MKFLFKLILLACIAPAALATQSDYIDSIVAIVEDDVITNSELAREIEQIREDLQRNGRKLPQTAALNRQVLELIASLQEKRS